MTLLIHNKTTAIYEDMMRHNQGQIAYQFAIGFAGGAAAVRDGTNAPHNGLAISASNITGGDGVGGSSVSQKRANFIKPGGGTNQQHRSLEPWRLYGNLNNLFDTYFKEVYQLLYTVPWLYHEGCTVWTSARGT